MIRHLFVFFIGVLIFEHADLVGRTKPKVDYNACLEEYIEEHRYTKERSKYFCSLQVFGRGL